MSEHSTTMDDLRWVVCPVCRRFLLLEADFIRCQGCNRHYPIVDGIPVLLEDRALTK